MKALELEHESVGWNIWKGGDMPVNGLTMVEVETDYQNKEVGLAHEFHWDELFTHVTAYRVLGTEVISPEEDEAFESIEKQKRYLKADGTDLIDKWAATHTPEDFRLIMFTMMDKYRDRLGKKDSIAKECRKIADFANRLALVEECR
jgi:hypothetical protein